MKLNELNPGMLMWPAVRADTVGGENITNRMPQGSNALEHSI